MKWFLIIYSTTKLVGFAGPLPYDEHECLVRKQEKFKPIEQAIASGKSETGQVLPTETLDELRKLDIVCEQRDRKPTVGEQRQ